jgi:CBS domain-containing protein
MTTKFEVATVSGSYRAPSYEDATVRDAMRQGVVRCALDTPLTDVARMMANYRVHAIVVTDTAPFDREPDQHLWGVVTDEMIVRSGGLARSRTAGGVATRDVATVKPDDSLRDAARAMLARGSSHAIVVGDSGHPIGVVSTLDIADVIGWAQD